MKQLSYETLYDIKEMLIQQIEKEKKAVNLLNYDNGKLQNLQKDISIINQLITDLHEQAYKDMVNKSK